MFPPPHPCLPSTSPNSWVPIFSFVPSFYITRFALSYLLSEDHLFTKQYLQVTCHIPNTFLRIVSGFSFLLLIIGRPCIYCPVLLFLNLSCLIHSFSKGRAGTLMLRTYPTRTKMKTSQRKCPYFPLSCL